MKPRTTYTLIGASVLACWLAVETSAGTISEVGSGWFSSVALLVLLAFCIFTAAYLCLRRLPPLAGLVCGTVGFGLFLFSYLPGGSGVLEHRTTSNGTEIALIQREGGDPYFVDFYFRPSGGNWGWYYYEHEDTRWPLGVRRIRLSPDGKKATIHRFIFPVASLDLDNGEFTLKRWGRSSPAQKIMPSNWNPSHVTPHATE